LRSLFCKLIATSVCTRIIKGSSVSSRHCLRDDFWGEADQWMQRENFSDTALGKVYEIPCVSTDYG
jgi:hypothetical protein